MTTVAHRITPHEIIVRMLHRSYSKYRQEGSRERSALHAVWCFLAVDERRYVRFNFSTGKFTTIQEPDFEPLYDQAKTPKGPQ